MPTRHTMLNPCEIHVLLVELTWIWDGFDMDYVLCDQWVDIHFTNLLCSYLWKSQHKLKFHNLKWVTWYPSLSAGTYRQGYILTIVLLSYRLSGSGSSQSRNCPVHAQRTYSHICIKSVNAMLIVAYKQSQNLLSSLLSIYSHLNCMNDQWTSQCTIL
jgi:hypothetical protein